MLQARRHFDQLPAVNAYVNSYDCSVRSVFQPIPVVHPGILDYVQVFSSLDGTWGRGGLPMQTKRG